MKNAVLIFAVLFVAGHWFPASGHHYAEEFNEVLAEQAAEDTTWFIVDAVTGRRKMSLRQVKLSAAASTSINVTDDETPSVSGSTVVTLANTTIDTVTDFEDGVEGQIIVVIGDGFTTLQDSSGLDLTGALDLLMLVGQTVTFVKTTVGWRELSRTL